jgi:hypothetical protein
MTRVKNLRIELGADGLKETAMANNDEPRKPVDAPQNEYSGRGVLISVAGADRDQECVSRTRVEPMRMRGRPISMGQDYGLGDFGGSGGEMIEDQNGSMP